MTSARKLCLVALAALVFLPVVGLADIIRYEISSFPLGFDPNPPEFTLQAVDPTGPRPGLSENLAATPLLTYGQTVPSPGEPVSDTMMMSWQPADDSLPATAGWELAFGSDPDLRNAAIFLSVMPPGGIGAGGLFVGISTISVLALDNNGIVAGGWGFNTDQAGLLGPPLNDPLAAGLHSLMNNAMHNVLINVGLGPAAGSATVTPIAPAGPAVIGPNFLIGGNNNFANIMWLQYFENGNLRGQTNIPAFGQPGLINWWDHLSIIRTPEPTTMLLFGGGLIALARKRRKKK